MDALQVARRRRDAAIGEVENIRAQLFADDVDAERVDELREQLDRALAAFTAAEEDVKRAKQSATIANRRQTRADVNRGSAADAGNSASRDLTPPTAVELRERGELMYRAMRGRSMSEEDTARAERQWPVERLFARVQWLRGIGRLDQLSTEERQAWNAYQDVMRRALSGGLDATANDGAEFVPTALEMEIFAARQFAGPFASDARLRVFRLDHYGNLDIPVVTDKLKASGVAIATDAGADKPATGEVAFQPHKYKISIPVSSEVMMAPVNFDEFVMSEVGEAFGLGYNEQRTDGNGSGLNFAGAFAETASAANAVAIAANTAIAGTDVLALYKLLDFSHMNRPGSSVQAHQSTFYDLMALADGSGSATVAYVRFTADGKLVLPNGMELEINNALDSARNAAGNNLIGLCDMGSYGVFYAMGMRAAVEYFSLSDQYLMSWYQWTDGQRIRDAAFRRLRGKS